MEIIKFIFIFLIIISIFFVFDNYFKEINKPQVVENIDF